MKWSLFVDAVERKWLFLFAGKGTRTSRTTGGQSTAIAYDFVIKAKRTNENPVVYNVHFVCVAGGKFGAYILYYFDISARVRLSSLY